MFVEYRIDLKWQHDKFCNVYKFLLRNINIYLIITKQLLQNMLKVITAKILAFKRSRNYQTFV